MELETLRPRFTAYLKRDSLRGIPGSRSQIFPGTTSRGGIEIISLTDETSKGSEPKRITRWLRFD